MTTARRTCDEIAAIARAQPPKRARPARTCHPAAADRWRSSSIMPTASPRILLLTLLLGITACGVLALVVHLAAGGLRGSLARVMQQPAPAPLAAHSTTPEPARSARPASPPAGPTPAPSSSDEL